MDVNSLYNKALSGDGDSREQLFKALLDSFRAIIQHKIWDYEESEEVVQNTLKTISEKLDEVDNIVNFKAWAYQVLYYKVGDYYREQRKRSERQGGTIQDREYSEAIDPDPEFMLQLTNCLKRIGRANRRYARALVLKYQGFSTDEICEKLEVSRNGLYIVLKRARDMLKLCLEDKVDNDE